jgi:hypothetical protein
LIARCHLDEKGSMQAERDIDKAITLHFLIFIGDLPPFIVPLVKLELPASEPSELPEKR